MNLTRTAKYSTKKERVTIERTVDSVEIDLDFTQMYNCFLLLSFKIKAATSFHLMFYLLQTMDKNNMVTINASLLKAFNEVCKQTGRKPIAEQTFYNSLKDLQEAEAMKKLNKGQYVMNIYSMWKGDKAKRIEYLISEKKDGQQVFKNPLHMILPEVKPTKDYIQTITETPIVEEICEQYHPDDHITVEELEQVQNNGQDM